MAIKPQDQLTEETDPTADNLWINGQISDVGNQVKIQAKNSPFEIRTGEGIWEFDNSTADSDQGAGRVWFNNATQPSTTIVYISDIDELGKDWGNDFLQAQIGDRFTVVEDIGSGYEFEVNGTVVAGAGYSKLPVLVVKNLGSAISNGARCQIKGSATLSGSVISNALKGAVGWAYYVDSTYTSGSPLALNSGNSYSASLSIDGLGSGSTVSEWPSSVTEPWDTTTNKMVATNQGDVFDVRIELKAQDGSSTNLLDVDLNIAGSVGEIYRESITIAKGASTETSVVLSTQVFTGADFVSNGGLFTLSTDSVDMDIWGMEIFIYRKFVG